MEEGGLRRVYGEILAEAEVGRFGPPDEGELTAEQILAHLALNDELMIEATEAVRSGSPVAYYDLGSVHRPELDTLIEEQGGQLGLVRLLRATSGRLCDLVEGLGPAGQTPVETHLREGFSLVVDETLPWDRTLDLHVRVHLPAHLEQLRALRAS
jgi:hypothetical protein